MATNGYPYLIFPRCKTSKSHAPNREKVAVPDPILAITTIGMRHLADDLFQYLPSSRSLGRSYIIFGEIRYVTNHEREVFELRGLLTVDGK